MKLPILVALCGDVVSAFGGDVSDFGGPLPTSTNLGYSIDARSARSTSSYDVYGGGSTMCPSATACCEVGPAACGGSPNDDIPKRVCAFDPSCCNTAWDQQCVNEANAEGHSCSDWRGSGKYCLQGNVFSCENPGGPAQLVENCGDAGCSKSEESEGDKRTPYGGGGGVYCPSGVNWYGEGNYCLSSNIFYCRTAGAKTDQMIENCGIEGCVSEGNYLQRTCDYTQPDATCAPTDSPTDSPTVPSGPQKIFVGRCSEFTKQAGGRAYTIATCATACQVYGSDRFAIDTTVEEGNGLLGRCLCADNQCREEVSGETVKDPSWTTYSV